MANIKKKNIVKDLSKTLTDNAHYAIIEFDNISHSALENLKKELKGAHSHFRVLKNSLFEKAVNQLSQKEKVYKEVRNAHFPLKNKSALLTFKEEWGEGLKKYYEFAKSNKSFSFKFGYLENQLYDDKGLAKLAQLPSKDQIMGQIIGAMKNPMVRTTRTLTSPIQKFVYILRKKSQSA